MNNMTIFNFNNTAIRTLLDEQGEPLFCAKDVCDVLDYSNDSDAIQKHCREAGVAKRDLWSGGQNRQMTFINEGNLYRLIIKSNKPQAEPFEAWVCDDVLPTIRKTGSYGQQSNMAANANHHLLATNPKLGVILYYHQQGLTLSRMAVLLGLSVRKVEQGLDKLADIGLLNKDNEQLALL